MNKPAAAALYRTIRAASGASNATFDRTARGWFNEIMDGEEGEDAAADLRGWVEAARRAHHDITGKAY